MPGPKPTPTKILKMRGSWRGDTRKNEPKMEPGAPRRPTWLVGEGAAAWRQIVPRLDKAGLLSLVDRHALARYCDAWSRWQAASVWLREHGEVYPIKDDAGKVKYFKRWPQAAIYTELCGVLSRLEAEFGLTPSARTRLEVAKQPEQKPTGKGRFFGGA